MTVAPRAAATYAVDSNRQEILRQMADIAERARRERATSPPRRRDGRPWTRDDLYAEPLGRYQRHRRK